LKGLIIASDQEGNLVQTPQERKGNPRLYFSLRLARFVPPQKSAMYKANTNTNYKN